MTVKAKLPENEPERLAALKKYEILDTLPEQSFDDLTHIAASICDTPITLVSLIDQDRQWFKSSTGIDGVTETPRDIAFCAHAILDTATMVIPDAQKDQRFAANPLVTGDMKVRFYAGAPLITSEGLAVGTLCAIDNKPRELNESQRLSLEALARQVVAQMELRVHIKTLERQAKELEANRENSLRKILETMQSGLLVFNSSGKIERSNRSIEAMLGYSAEELKEIDAHKLFNDQSILANQELQDGSLIEIAQHQETELKTKNGALISVLLSTSVLTDSKADLQAWVCVAQDLSSTKAMQAQLLSSQKLEAIGRLAAGISHEINTPIQFIGDNTRFLLDALNDFLKATQFIKDIVNQNHPSSEAHISASSLLAEIDVDFLTEEVPRAIEQTLEGVSRVSKIVRAMKEFSHPGTDQKQLVNLNKLIESTAMVCTNEWKYVATLETDLDKNLALVSCLPGEFNQVILNLIVNSAHALESAAATGKQEKGLIKISTSANENYAVIKLEDNGCGIPEEIISRVFDPFFTTKEVGKGTGQGLAIARSVVVDKHGGSINVTSKLGVGTVFTILLPLKAAAEPQVKHLEYSEGVSL